MDGNQRVGAAAAGVLLAAMAWYAVGQPGYTGASGSPAPTFSPLSPPANSPVASTTTSTTTGVGYLTDDLGNLVAFYPTDPAVLVANADIDGDGVNDMITVIVTPSLPPPFEEPSYYGVNVTSGATGLTIHNFTVASPFWWS